LTASADGDTASLTDATHKAVDRFDESRPPIQNIEIRQLIDMDRAVLPNDV
jgi:hypothetical protein